VKKPKIQRFQLLSAQCPQVASCTLFPSCRTFFCFEQTTHRFRVQKRFFSVSTENKKIRGKGILVFNPEDPEKSRYLTVKDLDQDLALAEEMMHEHNCNMFKKIIEFIESKNNLDLALVAMIQQDGVALHIVDPKEVDKRINEFTRGIII
jgi:hypothetical protein